MAALSDARPVAVPPPPALIVRRGSILCYRIFDVGNELLLDRAEELLAGTSRVKLSRSGSEVLSFASHPLNVGLGRRPLELEKLGRTFSSEASARLFDYGAVSVLFQIDITPDTPLADLTPICDVLYESDGVTHAARRELDTLLDRFLPAVRGPHYWAGAETYTVVFLEELVGHPSAREILAADGLGKLLLGETGPKPLAASERDELRTHRLSYFEDDLALVDWNSAVVVEPSGSRDIPDILEFASSQLLELRYYDALLDQEIAHIYDEFDAARRVTILKNTFRSPYFSLARDVLRRWVELSEFTERVENAVKVTGDFYLARVYGAAVERFQLRNWQTTVDTKLQLVAQVYSFIRDEIHTRRGMALEITVVILICFEILMAFFRH
jgi:hypothetical protein